jgi:hypothetical protein
MRFKEFLLLEFGFSDSGSDWFYGSSLYPSDAFDWEDTFHEPQDFKLLQSRWKREKALGRKFHNLDVQKTLDTKFTSVYSNTMPDTDDGFWKHRADDRPNLTIDSDAPLELRGFGKTHKHVNILTKSNNLLDRKKELNQLFGKFEPKYPKLSKDFDEPWVNKSK